jgi:hypothetical protein
MNRRFPLGMSLWLTSLVGLQWRPNPLCAVATVGHRSMWR